MKAESNLGGLLGKASRLLSNQFNTDLLQHNLTVEQWSLLAVLWSEDAQKQKDLQAELLKDKATINSLVSYLVKSGFVTKKQDRNDKRSFIIALTEQGKAMKEVTIPIAMKNIGIAIDGINSSDLEITIKVLNQIIINLTKGKS
jgi:DNA-binding MarR family transcriptional regulator